jgi:hypothetical protein
MKSHILLKTKVLFVLSFLCLTTFAMGYPGGVSGYTLKTSTRGCYCHTSAVSSSVTLTINGPATLTTGQQANYSVVMTYTSTISKGGMNIAASGGTLANSDSRLKVLNGELTHPSAQTGTTTLTWNFKYTAPSTEGNQTLYATGCGVYSKWNNAANFTVNVSNAAAGTISLLTPAAGDSLLVGNSKNITWTSTGVTNVKLEYSTDNGTIWNTIVALIPASAGSYSWIVPNTPSVQCKIRISDASNAAVKSESSVFTINAATYADLEIKGPSVYSLEQNYPNPFNPSTSIFYSLPVASDIKITIYNSKGEVVDIPLNSYKTAGQYKIIWNSANRASGIYFYRIDAGRFSQTKKMVLLK